MNLSEIGSGLAAQVLKSEKVNGALDSLTWAGYALLAAGLIVAAYYALKIAG